MKLVTFDRQLQSAAGGTDLTPLAPFRSGKGEAAGGMATF